MTIASHDSPRDAALNMLVLDDSEFDRRNLCRVGQKTGLPMQIQTVPDLSSMAQKMDRTPFDVVLLDYGLPDGNGFHAVDLVRKHHLHRDAAVIMISGREQIDLAVKAMQKGCESYLCKGALTPATLRQAILDAKDHRLRHMRHPSATAEALAPILAEGMEIAFERLDMRRRIRQSPGFADFLEGMTASTDDRDPFLN